MHLRIPSAIYALTALSSYVILTTLQLSAQTSVTTAHNDIGRTGQNLTETTLTPSNVNTAGFGKLLTLAVDGQVYAQPLYVPSVTINGTAHRVVFAATEHDSVFAFDAATGTQLWKASLLDTAHGAAGGATTDPESDTGCGDISALNGSSEYGITGTPVIDAASGTLYVVSKTLEAGSVVQRLHALDITTGNEKFGGPATIQASVKGSGSGSSGGTLSFNAKWENQRPGLLLVNGNVYIGFASHCDLSNWHGWLLGYNATTLAQTAVFQTTPNGSASGIWMGGAGLAADVQNGVARIFPVTGNGSYDAKAPYGTNTMDYGDDILNLTVGSNGSLTVADEFTPDNQASLSGADTDVGSGGALLMPDQPGAYPHLLVQLGKSGAVYVVDRDAMGGYSTSANAIVQQFSASGGLWGMPAYWNGNVYIWPSSGRLNRYPVTNGLLSTSPAEVSAESQSQWYGSTPSVSSNGTQGGIVWSIDWSKNPEVVYAHNATKVSQLLWSSAQNSTRDSAGTPVKFVVPTIADGNVFVGANNQVVVYGLLPPAVPDFGLTAAPTALGIQIGGTATVQLTVTPLNGFSGAVTFTTVGLPPGVTATFAQGSSSNTYLMALSAAANATVTNSPATVTVTGAGATTTHSVSLSLSVSNTPPAVTVNPANSGFNVYGIFNNGSPVTNGGLDNAGYAYSAALLGSSLTAGGLPYVFGAPATANAAANITITLPAGNYTSLNLLGAGVNGNQAGQAFLVTYTDGSTTTFTQSLSDWFTPQNYTGETKVGTLPYRLNSTGATDNRTFYLYGYSFALNAGKTVKSLKLPANRNVTILAITLASNGTTTPQSQTITFNQIAAQTVGSTLTLNATASSGLSVTYASNTTSVCTVSGSVATFVGAGTCTIVASQTGNATYAAATPLTQSFSVNAVAQGTFTLSTSASTVTVTPPTCFFIFCSGGASATDKITVVPANGFNGTVAFSIKGLPTGVTASFSPASSNSAATLTLTPASNAGTGHTTTLTITGTSGTPAVSSSANITLKY